MSQYKSKAEERRMRHYGGHNQGGDHFGAGREAKLIAARERAKESRDDKLAALRAKVVEMQMYVWRARNAGLADAAWEAAHALDDACAALDAAERETP